LAALDVHGTQVTGAGFDNLKALSLGHLNASGAAIDDSGLEKLAEIGTLREVLLRGSKVTATGVAKLKEALPNCRLDLDPEIEAALKSKK
jgi:hypothetical protein